MRPDLARAVTILKREALFEGLDTSQLARIANYFDMLDVERDTTLFSENERADYFYFILSGHVRLTHLKRGRERLLNVMGPGDYFGEMALLFDRPRTATATTIEKSTLLRLKPERFQMLLDEYPNIRRNLSITAESRRLIRKQQFDWLGEDEIVYLVTRKHRFFLITRLILPAFFLILSLIGIWVAVLEVGINIFKNPSGFFGMLGLVIFSIMIWWVWLDWGNDFYIVTSRRAVWKEKVVALYDSRREAPLNVVLAVDVSTTQLGRIIGYGNVDVRTYTGSILMRNMDDPKLFASFVKGYQKRFTAFAKDRQIQEIEQAIEEAILQRLKYEKGEIPVATAPPAVYNPVEQKKKEPQSPGERWRNFLKVRYEVKTDRGTVITYRKHWFILFKRVWLPLLLTSIPMISLFLYFTDALPLLFTGFALLFGLFLVLWLWYETEDWRNDIYRLTPDQIMDMEKKPLGREKKTTAPLDSPDFRVEHERSTIIGIILDFGNVKINVGQTEFTFDGVYHPDQVHQDVSDYREANQQQKRSEQEKSERERMIDWLVAYYKSADQIDVNMILEASGLGEQRESV